MALEEFRYSLRISVQTLGDQFGIRTRLHGLRKAIHGPEHCRRRHLAWQTRYGVDTRKGSIVQSLAKI